MKNIIVSTESVNHSDEYELVYSNIDCLNRLFQAHILADEVSQDAMRSYYVDYYLSQMDNGGFTQFIYNSHWNSEAIRYVLEGLDSIKAVKNLVLFEQSAKVLDGFGIDKIRQYLEGTYFGTNEERDILSGFDDEFFALKKDEDLVHLNYLWLKNHPDLEILNDEEITAHIERIADAIPNIEERRKAAMDAEPRYLKLIKALCNKSGQVLERITTGDPSKIYRKKKVMAWHFITNEGHHHMLEFENEAIMFKGNSEETMLTISAGDEYGV